MTTDVPEPRDDASWERSSGAPMPSLALPFAIFGAAAGLFVTLGLGAAFFEMRDTPPWQLALAALGIGALLGVVLRRWRWLHAPLGARDVRIGGVTFALMLAGIAVGTAWYVMRWPLDAYYLGRTALQSALLAIVFLPGCIFVLDAGARAARARHGSIVAEVDRRTIAVTVTGATACTTLVQLPALLVAETSRFLPVVVQALLAPALCLACLAALAAFQRKDDAAITALERATDAATELAGDVAIEIAPVDLGLGSERWGRAVGFATYRSNASHEVLVRGSISEARAAMAHALRLRERTTAVVVTVTLANVLASAALVANARGF